MIPVRFIRLAVAYRSIFKETYELIARNSTIDVRTIAAGYEFVFDKQHEEVVTSVRHQLALTQNERFELESGSVEQQVAILVMQGMKRVFDAEEFEIPIRGNSL